LTHTVECHILNKYVHTKESVDVQELDAEDIELLRWRAELADAELETICLLHKSHFISHFEHSKWKCCDPMNRHKTVVRKSLRPIAKDFAKKLQSQQLYVKPGEKLCPSCHKMVSEKMPDSESSDSDFIPEEELKASLDISMTSLGCSPLKLHGVKDRVSYGKRKVKSMQEKATSKVSKVLSVPQSDGDEVSESVECDSCNDLAKLIEALTEKCAVSSSNEQVKLLTLVPQSWSIQRVVSEFSV